MNYFSTNHLSPAVNFKTATIDGLAPDKGLYFPEEVPAIDSAFFKDINSYSKEEIALRMIAPYVGDEIPRAELKKIVSETVDFDFPLVHVHDDIFSLELFHGPTLAFKDVGARFMSRCLGYFVKNNNRKITVLVATSGDTGGAVANGFYGIPGIDVVILYPSGKVSNLQEVQLTTLGNNIHALEVAGTFDDCQRLVKQAFVDAELKQDLFLTSANSINIARWLSQQFYYAFAWQQWPDKSHPPVISVPSGNLGNLCAGLLAHRSGLPVAHFIAACNANNAFTQYLDTRNYQSKPTLATISNAMDVGDPSNFVRILQMYEQRFEPLAAVVSSESITDEQTKETLLQLYTDYGYLMDPHGAVAYRALKNCLANDGGGGGIFLETAHPIKFNEVIEPLIQKTLLVPDAIGNLLDREKQKVKIDADYKLLVDFLRSIK